jgi:hypothetical protein
MDLRRDHERVNGSFSIALQGSKWLTDYES